MRVVRGKRRSSIGFQSNQTFVKVLKDRTSYLSGSESSVNRLTTSPSGGTELLLDEVITELLSRESFDRLSCKSNSVTKPGTGGTSSSTFWFFFFRFRREARSLEIPLDPALAESGPSPACVFGRSAVESIDERPLLRPEPSIASDSADTVQARRDLPP